MRRGLAVSYEQKIRGMWHLVIAVGIAAFLAGMLFIFIISMPPVWIDEVTACQP